MAKNRLKQVLAMIFELWCRYFWLFRGLWCRSFEISKLLWCRSFGFFKNLATFAQNFLAALLQYCTVSWWQYWLVTSSPGKLNFLNFWFFYILYFTVTDILFYSFCLRESICRIYHIFIQFFNFNIWFNLI